MYFLIRNTIFIIHSVVFLSEKYFKIIHGIKNIFVGIPEYILCHVPLYEIIVQIKIKNKMLMTIPLFF